MSSFTITVLVVLGILLLLVLWGISLYNRMVASQQRVAEGWSGIDVQLKRRSNLVPNLVATVKGYAAHERETLDAVVARRGECEAAQGVGTARRAQAERALSGALMQLFALAESYPELKADTNFRELQQALARLEDEIQMARRYYNGSARQLNTLIGQFPSNIVGNMFRFETAEYFEIENAADRALPTVEF